MGGSNVVIGIGLYTSGNNPRAVAALWKSGASSMMNDVRFLGGHGTPRPDGSRENPYNSNHTADPNPSRHWDRQYPSLWVTDGGGGAFLDIWTPSTFAQAGMLVSGTETDGRVYQMSSEHHVRHEVQIRNAAHWRFYALQTEAERGESGFDLPLEIASGFYNVSGGATAPTGDFYFVDAHWQRIYRWSVAAHQLSTICDSPLDPVNLAVDTAGNVVVVSYAGKGVVYSVRPDGSVLPLESQPLAAKPGLRFVLPVSDWRLNRQSLSHPTAQFVSPDGTLVIPVGADFLGGAVSWGVKSSPQLRSFGLDSALPGKPFYVSDEAGLATWAAKVNPDGSLDDFRLFVEQGGEGVTLDSRGNVYVAAGQIYVYSPSAKLIDTIEVPERPLQMVFGGADRRTLFIPARTSLYSVRMRFPGR